MALILLAYGVAELVGGNGFVAAFCMGATAGNIGKAEQEKMVHAHLEVEVERLMLLTFLIFGAMMLPPALDSLNGVVALYAIISLTLIRVIRAAISMIGDRMRPITTFRILTNRKRARSDCFWLVSLLKSRHRRRLSTTSPAKGKRTNPKDPKQMLLASPLLSACEPLSGSSSVPAGIGSSSDWARARS